MAVTVNVGVCYCNILHQNALNTAFLWEGGGGGGHFRAPHFVCPCILYPLVAGTDTLKL